MKRDSISLSLLAVAGVMMAFPTVLAGQYSQNEAATKVDSSNYPSDILRGYKTYEAKCSTCHQLGGLTRKLRAIPSQNKFWVMNMQARPSTNISDNEVTRILAYLAYDSSRQMSTVMDQNPADPMTAKMVAEGRQFFLSQSCNACHTVGADTASGGPALDNVGHARNRQQLLDRIKRMCSGADKTMPPLPSDTPDEQINALVDYLQTLKGKA